MSHGPFGRCGATFRPACWAIVNVAPISVSATASTRTNLVRGFMSILISVRRASGLPHWMPRFEAQFSTLQALFFRIIYAFTRIYLIGYTKRVESVFEIIAEPNR